MSDTSSFTGATPTLKSLNAVMDSPESETLLDPESRADLLPLLFRVRGQPYSLANYPQFKEMYNADCAPNTIFMCGRQIGKSMNLSRSEVLDLLSVPHFQLLYVAPLQAQTQRYSTLYLTEAIKSCPLAGHLQKPEISKDVVDSQIVARLHHYTFSNGAGIQLTYAKTSSDRARGIYADRIDFDEIQDQLVDNIPIITESLTASSYGLRRFTGTAKTTDNTIEALWSESSQCEWVMRCSACNYWNIPNVDGKVIDMIQGDGMHCKKCGRLLNVREGVFVPAHPDRHHLFRGFHIPQVIIPAIVEDPQKWSALVRKVIRLPLPTIMQEVLGISCSEGARLITKDDILRCSTLPNTVELQKHRNQYIFTIGGIDWGVAEHDSFTVHTIIGVRPDGKIHVLWARRFVGFNPDEVLSEIARAHHYYNCQFIGADFGMGFDKNVMLEQRFGLPVIQIMYVRQNRLLQYNPLMGHHRWTVDKTTALELLFLAIKYGRIQFPPTEEFEIYTNDLLSPYEEAVESAGMTYRHFVRNPNQPDDFAHALCFATMVAMRVMHADITDMVPAGGMGRKEEAISGKAPVPKHIDPRDILASLKV